MQYTTKIYIPSLKSGTERKQYITCKIIHDYIMKKPPGEILYMLFHVQKEIKYKSYNKLFCLFSLVVKRQSCKLKIVSSILTGGINELRLII